MQILLLSMWADEIIEQGVTVVAAKTSPRGNAPGLKKSMNLIDAAGKCGDEDLLWQLVEPALTKLMQFEVEQQLSASQYERSAEQAVYRNRYRERVLETHLYTLGAGDPKIACGQQPFFPSLLEPARGFADLP